MIRSQGRALLAALAIAASGIGAEPAQAQVLNWSLTGAGCVPTGQTAAGTGTFNSAGDAKFAAGRLGEIIVTCPVPSSIPSASVMSITYRDTDGPGTVVQVRAALRQKSLDTGAVADVPAATFNSNGFPAAAGNVRRFVQIANVCNTNVPFNFDHARFTYYIQVNMTKRANSQDVLLASVHLGPTQVC